MQLPGYRDWLFSEDKKPFFVDGDIVAEGDKDTLLKPDGNPARLTNGPDGWRDTLIKYGRNLSYWGLFREFTVPMRFTKDGAKILRYMFWEKGMEGIVHYGKSKLNRLAYPHVYEPWFLGEIDLSKFRQIQKDSTVVVNVMEGGLSKLLKAFENTSYDIRIDTDIDKKTLYLDGVPFTNKITWTVYNGQDIQGTALPQYYWLGMGIVGQEGTSQGIVVQDQLFENTTTFPNDKYCMGSIDKNVVAKVKGRIQVECTDDNFGNDSTLILNAILASDTSNTIFSTYPILTGSPHSQGDIFWVDIDLTIPIAPHQRLYFRIAGVPWTIHLFTVKGGEITVEYDVTFSPTYCEGLKAYTLFERLAEKLTNGKYGVKSTFLENREDLFYTSGPALRKYQSEAKIVTSIFDFYRECKLRGTSRYGVGMAIENDKIIIEELNYFFRPEVIVDLGVVNDLEINEAEDIQFNTLKVGYLNQTIDKVNGRDEVNVTQKYTTPHTKIVKEMDLVGPYRADMYGIEVTRLDLSGKDTTDNKADQDTFVISVKKDSSIEVIYFTGDFQTEINTGFYYIKIPSVLSTIPIGLSIIISGSVSNDGTYTVESTSYIMVGYTYIKVTQPVTNESITGVLTFINTYMYELLRLPYTSITGVLHPAENFNTELSPKRCLLNNGSVLRSLLDKHDTNKIIFQTGEKNSELSTTLAGETITENADVVIGSLKERLFLPYYFNFTTQVPIDFLTIMKANPYGKIKFTDRKTGAILYGYMWDGGIKPEPNDKQTWKLISANQDLSKLK